MTRIKIVYTPTASNTLQHLHPVVKKPLKEIIEELSTDPYRGKPLRDEFQGFRSYRFKRYRVVYRYQEEKNLIEILLAGPRKDIYLHLADLVRRMKR